MNPEWILIFITAIYVFFAGLQWRAIKRQADLTNDMVESNKRAAEAASNNALAAKDNALAATKSAENYVAVERPWIDVWGPAFVQNRGLVAGAHPWAVMKFANRGRTPAIVLSLSVQGVIAVALPLDPVYREVAPHLPNLPPSGVLLIPGQQQQLQTDWPVVTEDQIRQIQASHLHVWVYGRFIYRDFAQRGCPNRS